MCKILNSNEIRIAKEKLGFSNPIHGGICPVCGSAVATNDTVDTSHPDIYGCTKCLFYCDDYSSFNDISGVSEQDANEIKELLDNANWIDITDHKQIANEIKDAYDNYYNALGNALVNYLSYMVSYASRK